MPGVGAVIRTRSDERGMFRMMTAPSVPMMGETPAFRLFILSAWH